MISRVFGKTKPINYIIAIGFFLFCLILVKLRPSGIETNSISFGHEAFVVLCILLCLLLVSVITLSSQLIPPSVLSFYFFSSLLLIFPEIIYNHQAIIANVFILTSVLRLNQIKSFNNIRSNLFDASLSVLIASLFLQWALLYMILIWVYIYAFNPKNVRIWFIPFAVTILFGLLITAAFMIFNNVEYLANQYTFSKLKVDRLFSLNSSRYLIFLGGVVVLAFYGFRKLNKYGYGKALLLRLTAIYLLISLTVIMLQLSSSGIAVFLVFYPASLYIGLFVASIRKKLFKELFLVGIFVLGLLVFASEWIR